MFKIGKHKKHRKHKQSQTTSKNKNRVVLIEISPVRSGRSAEGKHFKATGV